MNIKDLTQRMITAALLGCLCLTGLTRSVEAQDGLPIVTIMQAGSGEFESDVEAVMKLAGKKGEDQWPVIEAILPAFTQGVDADRPIRVDVILGEERDYRLSIPYTDQKAILNNVAGFIGAKPRRVGAGLYLLKSQAYNGYLRDLSTDDYVIIAAERDHIPRNFDPMPGIQPLIDAGYDAAVSVTNTAEGIEDRRQAIDDLRKELLDGLENNDDETEQEFEIRRTALVHQLEEMERLFAESKRLVLGWTTDTDKNEGRLALDLTPLEGTDLADTISEIGTKSSLFAKNRKSDDTIFFGHVNHPLDQMRQQNIAELLKLVEDKFLADIDGSEDIEEANKDAAKDAVQTLFDMLNAGNRMGVVDGFVNVTEGDDGRSIVGAIRAEDGTVADQMLASLKEAGWTVELAEPVEAEAAAEKPESPAEKTEEDSKEAAPEKKAESGNEAASEEGGSDEKASEENASEEKAASTTEPSDEEADEPAEEAPAKDEGTEEAEVEDTDDAAEKNSDAAGDGSEASASEIRIHTVTLPVSEDGDFVNLFGADAELLVVTTKDAVYYASGQGKEKLIKEAVAATEATEPRDESIFFETWSKLGPWIEYLKERREREEADQDLSELSEEEQQAREERLKLRDMAIEVFNKGQDTIHTTLSSDQEKVTGMTVFAEGMLRFAGAAIADFAKTRLE